jgi:DNA processing protein
MNLNSLNDNSFVLLLLHSSLGFKYNNEESYKLYSPTEFGTLYNQVRDSQLENIKNLLTTDIETIQSMLNLSEYETARLKYLLGRSANLSLELTKLSSLGVNVTTVFEQDYPRKLVKKLDKKAPYILYFCGNMNLTQNNGVAVVGSRKIDEQAEQFISTLTQKCATESFTIISGGAKGTDGLAEKFGLEHGCKIISVVPDSLAKRIKNKSIRTALINNDMLLLSSSDPNAHFAAYRAMERNKYIYGLADYSVIVSSSNNEGGTWAGAIENLKFDWTPSFVRDDVGVPSGNKELISRGVSPITSDDIARKSLLDTFSITSNKKEKYIQDSLF